LGAALRSHHVILSSRSRRPHAGTKKPLAQEGLPR
jgi:hypothetical protein